MTLVPDRGAARHQLHGRRRHLRTGGLDVSRRSGLAPRTVAMLSFSSLRAAARGGDAFCPARSATCFSAGASCAAASDWDSDPLVNLSPT